MMISFFLAAALAAGGVFMYGAHHSASGNFFNPARIGVNEKADSSGKISGKLQTESGARDSDESAQTADEEDRDAELTAALEAKFRERRGGSEALAAQVRVRRESPDSADARLKLDSALRIRETYPGQFEENFDRDGGDDSEKDAFR